MEYQKHTSLKDLAKALGVSIPTVSRALKDSPEISSELRTKVKKLAKEMNYRPNPFAMSLRKNTPRCAGYRYPFLRIHPERNRKHGSSQRIFCYYYHFT